MEGASNLVHPDLARSESDNVLEAKTNTLHGKGPAVNLEALYLKRRDVHDQRMSHVGLSHERPMMAFPALLSARLRHVKQIEARCRDLGILTIEKMPGLFCTGSARSEPCNWSRRAMFPMPSNVHRSLGV
jgi:hypothetical protein